MEYFTKSINETYDASITHVFCPNFDRPDGCDDWDCKVADEKIARLLAKWLKRLPGDAILMENKNKTRDFHCSFLWKGKQRMTPTILYIRTVCEWVSF